MLGMPIRSPPLFVITKQVDTNLSVDNLFYKVLEQRGYIREAIILELKTSFNSDEWAQNLIEGLKAETVHLFMQFSSQATETIELIEKDLSQNLVIDTIME
jgi:hypothetical protein